MELIRLEFASFRDFAREMSPRMTRDGLWLGVERLAPIGERVAFEIDLADGFRLLRGEGEVTAVVADGPPSGRGMAIAFQGLDAASRHLVDKIVARHRAVGGSVLVLPAAASAPQEAVGAEPAAESSAEAAGAVTGAGSEAGTWLAPAEEEQRIGELMVAELEGMLAGERPTPESPESAAPVVEPAADREDSGATSWREELARKERQELLKQRLREQLEEPGMAQPAGAGGPAPPVLMRTREALEPPRPAGPAWPAGAAASAHPSRQPRRLAVWAGAFLAAACLAWVVTQAPWQKGAAPAGAPEPSALEPTAPPSPAPGPPTAAAPAAAPSAAGLPERPPPFARVLTLAGGRQGETTVVTLELDGSAARDRWASERLTGERPREVVRLSGVASLPRPATLELRDSLVAAVRSGLHSGARGPELHLVVDLADPRARLAGIEAGERSLRLVFVRD